jgi:hypothetical protein
LIQIGAISILLCQHKPLFHCWKDICGLKLPRRVATSENDRLHIYILWYKLCRIAWNTVHEIIPSLEKKDQESSMASRGFWKISLFFLQSLYEKSLIINYWKSFKLYKNCRSRNRLVSIISPFKLRVKDNISKKRPEFPIRSIFDH